jgi:hypothetical protein
LKKKAIVVETDSLKDLQQRFAVWRDGGRKRQRIPEVLWDAAARLAFRIGVNPVSRALSLDYPRLKRRTAEVENGQQTRPLSAGAAFVELALEPAPHMPECSLEYEGRHGKVTIRLSGHSQPQVMALADRLAATAR